VNDWRLRPRASLRVRVIVFLREQVRKLVRVAAPSDLTGSVIVKIFHCVEGGGRRVSCADLETNLSCLRLFFSFSLISLLLISCIIIHAYLYMLDIICTLHLRKQLCISILILRGILRRSSEPFTGYLTSFLG